MKKGVLFVMLLFVAVSLVSASIATRSYSIKDIYYANEKLSGTINVSIVNQPTDSFFKTNLNQNISILNFLSESGASYSCSTFNCSNTFVKSSPSSSGNFPIGESETPAFGFVVNGPYVTINTMSFTINSNFNESAVTPLSLKFFGKSLWTFEKFSSNFSRTTDFGCFDQSVDPSYSKDIASNFMYCEKISLPRTSAVQLGAKINGTGEETFSLKLFNSNKAEISSCTFTTPSDKCNPPLSSAINAGDYYVCIKSSSAISNYKIASEQSGEKCGWWGSTSDIIRTDNATTDYGLFAKTPLFSKAESISISKSQVVSLETDANSYLSTFYNRNCSSGCVLPVSAFGVGQQITISNVSISYSLADGLTSDYLVYGISPTPAKINFSGILNLSFTGFDVGSKGNKTLSLSLDGTSVFSKAIKVLSYLNIFYITPNNPPAGVDITFDAEIASESSNNKFKWQWGDNTTNTETTIPQAVHRYESLGIFPLTLTLTDSNNFSISKQFDIAVGSPRDLVNISLSFKKAANENAIRTKNTFPSWYSLKLEKLANLSFFQDELRKLEAQKALALTDEDFLVLFNKIQALNMPYSISVGESSTSPLLLDLDSIDPTPIAEFTGGSTETLEGYREPIAQWQRENTNIQIKDQKIISTYTDKSIVPLISVISVTAKSSSSDESYFVIQKSFEDLNFKEEIGARKSGDSTIIVINPGETKIFDFYVTDEVTPVMYTAPKLSLLPLAAEIGVCNFNKVCEKDLQENYKNCRSDCFPVGSSIFWITLLVAVAIILYTALAYWYKTRYESFLFRDRRSLYNLLMFIANARVSGLSDAMIGENLKKQGWNAEQITYAVKKSRGKRTGLPEIIPFDKISAYFMQKKAKQNLNKYPNTGIIRW